MNDEDATRVSWSTVPREGILIISMLEIIKIKLFRKDPFECSTFHSKETQSNLTKQ